MASFDLERNPDGTFTPTVSDETLSYMRQETEEALKEAKKSDITPGENLSALKIDKDVEKAQE